MLLIEYSSVIVFFCSAIAYAYLFASKKSHRRRQNDAHLAVFAALLGLSYLLYIFQEGSLSIEIAGLSVDAVISLLQVINIYVIIKTTKSERQGDCFARLNNCFDKRVNTRQNN